MQSLGLKDSLEEEMEIHSGTLAWEIPWMGSLVGLKRLGYNLATK